MKFEKMEFFKVILKNSIMGMQRVFFKDWRPTEKDVERLPILYSMNKALEKMENECLIGEEIRTLRDIIFQICLEDEQYLNRFYYFMSLFINELKSREPKLFNNYDYKHIELFFPKKSNLINFLIPCPKCSKDCVYNNKIGYFICDCGEEF